MTDEEMRQQGEQRKARSIARLISEDVPVLDWLPWIECDPATIQPLESIARRTMVLGLLAVYAEPNGMPKDVLKRYLDTRGVMNDLTKEEMEFLRLNNPTDKERGKFTWQYESVHVLLWSLGFVESLGMPKDYCSAPAVSSVIAPRSVSQLMNNARLRSPEQIFDEVDLIFRYHWAARNADLQGKTTSGLIHPVCHYRHYALNWLSNSEESWDHVDTST